MSEWLAMGGHGVYVWTAYAIGFALLFINALWPFFAKKRFLREYFRDKARRQRREQPKQEANP